MLSVDAPKGGMQFDENGVPVYLEKFMANYMQSKVGCAWLADKFAQRIGDKGILSVVSLAFEDHH
jgi:hypothetical protein